MIPPPEHLEYLIDYFPGKNETPQAIRKVPASEIALDTKRNIFLPQQLHKGAKHHRWDKMEAQTCSTKEWEWNPYKGEEVQNSDNGYWSLQLDKCKTQTFCYAACEQFYVRRVEKIESG